jgi:hypothetical protein
MPLSVTRMVCDPFVEWVNIVRGNTNRRASKQCRRRRRRHRRPGLEMLTSDRWPLHPKRNVAAQNAFKKTAFQML